MHLDIRWPFYCENISRDMNSVSDTDVHNASKVDIAVCGNRLTSVGNHMPYGITQCYLPPGSGDFPVFTPAEAGTRFSNPGRMQGCVDLGGGCIPRKFTDEILSRISEITGQCRGWELNPRPKVTGPAS